MKRTSRSAASKLINRDPRREGTHPDWTRSCRCRIQSPVQRLPSAVRDRRTCHRKRSPPVACRDEPRIVAGWRGQSVTHPLGIRCYLTLRKDTLRSVVVSPPDSGTRRLAALVATVNESSLRAEARRAKAGPRSQLRRFAPSLSPGLFHVPDDQFMNCFVCVAP